MSSHLKPAAAGFVLLLGLAACGGTAAAAHSAGAKPTAPPVMHSRYAAPAAAANAPATHHNATAKPAQPPARPSEPAARPAQPPASVQPAPPSPTMANPIQQGNGGDHDGDNNGGPSDGDGTL